MSARGGVKSLVSFGSGPSVFEYMLKEIFQEDLNIVVTDYDSYIMERVGKLFPDIEAEVFDFYHDDVRKLVRKHKIDCALLIGSACSMDDKTYIRFLKDLKKSGVNYVITFEAAITNNYVFLKKRIRSTMITIYHYLRKVDGWRDKGSFHAYERSKYQLEHIFAASGYKMTMLTPLQDYKYIYLLTLPEK